MNDFDIVNCKLETAPIYSGKLARGVEILSSKISSSGEFYLKIHYAKNSCNNIIIQVRIFTLVKVKNNLEIRNTK